MTPLLFAIGSAASLCEQICRAHGFEPGRSEQRHFPDGETYFRYLTPVAGREVALVCSLDRPDEKATGLLFAAAAAREQGAKRVGLVAPYLAYMRQDRAFLEGEAITSTAFARIIDAHFDWLVTIDPHLHRHRDLSDVFSIPVIAASAAPAIAGWIEKAVSRPVLIGPDTESRQWVERIAGLADARAFVLDKVRKGDRDVDISGRLSEIGGDEIPVIVDDVISTAATMVEAVELVTGTGLRPPVCVAVHAVFAGNAYRRLAEAGAERIVTTNTIHHSTNEIDVSAELGAALSSLIAKSG